MNANQGWGDGYLVEEFFEQFDKACYDLSLVPLLKKLAKQSGIYFENYEDFDDNSSGGFSHPRFAGKSFENEANEAIQIIKTNFERLSPTFQKIVTADAKTLESILNEIINGDSTELTLIPFLEQIAEEDAYLVANPRKKGFAALSKTIYLGEKAKKAIERIKHNANSVLFVRNEKTQSQ